MYEYEFGGEAKTTVKGLSTPVLSIKGSSGMLELGYIIQNKDVNAPAVDIGFQGWSGKKQGFSGNINFIWKFWLGNAFVSFNFYNLKRL